MRACPSAPPPSLPVGKVHHARLLAAVLGQLDSRLQCTNGEPLICLDWYLGRFPLEAWSAVEGSRFMSLRSVGETSIRILKHLTTESRSHPSP